jgi:zinc protease
MTPVIVGEFVLKAVSISLFALICLAGGAWADAPILHKTLPNGHNVYIQPSRTRPIVTIDTWVNTGSARETADNNGVSHFLEHLLFKGTPTYGPGEFDRLIESKGAVFNAATSDDFTHYYLTIPSDFFPEALKLHADMMLNAAIPATELDKERKVVQEEINRALDNPSRRLYMALSEALYGQHPYALDTLGPKSIIASIPRGKIIDYYQQWYRPEQFHTVIVGDVNPYQALKLVETAFQAGKQPKLAATVPLTSPPPLTGPKVFTLRDPQIKQAYVAVALLGPSIEHRQDAAALDIAMAALGQGKTSRLYRLLREEQPLVNRVQAVNQTQRVSGVLAVDAETRPENLNTVLRTLVRELQQLRAKGITPQELDKLKTQTIKDFRFLNESTQGVATSIGYNVTIGQLDDYTQYVSRIQSLTVEDVQAALNRYLDTHKAVVAMLLPTGQPTPDLAQVQRWLTEPPELLADKPANPNPAVSPISKSVLNNGITYLSRPLPQTDTVTVKFFVKGGQSTEPLPGMAPILASLMMKGTPLRDAEALNQELESKGMHLNIAAHDDYFEVTATALSEDLGELIPVVRDVLVNAKLDESDLEAVKTQIRQAIVSNQDTPSTVSAEKMLIALYPNHAYGNVGKRIEQHLPLIRPEILTPFYQRSFVPKNMVVSAAGRFDPAVLERYLLDLFPEALNRQADQPLQPEPVAPLGVAKTVKTERPNQAATWIFKGWLAPGIDSSDYVPLKVLNSLLGTGMSSRLFVTLREQQGLAYAVSSLYPSTAGKSRFVLYIGTDPKNQATVLKGFDQEIARLKTDLVSPQELKEAQDKLAGAFALGHETPAEQATYPGLYETLGAGYTFDQTYPEQIRQVTAEDIRRVAQKVFSQPAVTSIVGP